MLAHAHGEATQNINEQNEDAGNGVAAYKL